MPIAVHVIVIWLEGKAARTGEGQRTMGHGPSHSLSVQRVQGQTDRCLCHWALSCRAGSTECGMDNPHGAFKTYLVLGRPRRVTVIQLVQDQRSTVKPHHTVSNA
ncbi:hypothetical protein BaRGS_00014255 [Batillaria attramentaria]|uniref:Secreted protein n=1 Tax=Batillaria attramentaria TaxID=370345 RepID=A0ABD0L5I9_9CAEN